MTRMVLCAIAAFIVFAVFITANCSAGKSDKSEGVLVSKWHLVHESLASSTVPVGLIPHFFDENNGLATNGFNLVKTTDSGKNWSELLSFEKELIQTFIFNEDNVGWMTGHEYEANKRDRPIVLTSKNKGVTWTRLSFNNKDYKIINSTFTTFHDVCVLPTGELILAGDGGILTASAGEQELELVSLFKSERVFTISCDNGDIWAGGGDGFIYTFQNGWKSKQINSAYTFTKIRVFEKDFWALGYKRNAEDGKTSGVLLRSRNKRESWSEIMPATIGAFNDLYIKNDEGWLVGSDGQIFFTNDRGDSWSKAISPTKNSLLNITFYDANNGWITGNNGTVLKYIN